MSHRASAELPVNLRRTWRGWYPMVALNEPPSGCQRELRNLDYFRHVVPTLLIVCCKLNSVGVGLCGANHRSWWSGSFVVSHIMVSETRSKKPKVSNCNLSSCIL